MHILEWRYARQYFCVRLAINVGSKSFSEIFKTQLDTSLNKAQNKQELPCGRIFGYGGNVYVVEQPFLFSFNSDQSQNQGSATLTLTQISHLSTT
jgi:hypothetical protein